jgi:hypothetical protein
MLAHAFAWWGSTFNDVEMAATAYLLFSHSMDTDLSYNGKIFCQNARYAFGTIQALRKFY